MRTIRWLLLILPLSLAAQDRLKTMPGLRAGAARRARRPRGVLRRRAPGDVGGREQGVRVRQGRQALSLRRRDAAGDGDRRVGGSGRDGSGRASSGGHAGARPAIRLDAVAGRPLKAFYDNRNVWLSAADGSGARAITTDGSAAGRIKYGTASWVYGEELSQQTAMWWSPDSRKLAYYRFDEREVRDYYVTLNQTQPQVTLDVEAFPNAGTPNPVVDLFIYDVATRTDGAGRRARRPAVRQHVGRPLRLSRVVVGRWPRAAVSAHEPPPERDGAWRPPTPRPAPAGSCCAKSGRPAGSCPSRGWSFSPTARASSGSRSATAGTISTSTI